MDQSGGPPLPAPSYAGGPAGYRGQASSSSSPRPPPPAPPPQAHATQPLPPPPPQQQRQGHAVQPVPPPQQQQRQGYAIQPVPPQQQQQGHAIQPVWAWAWQPSPPLPFRFGPPVPRPIPPRHPQFWPQQHPYHLPLGPTVWGPTSNAGQYLGAMVAQQRPAAPTWPQLAQHSPTIHQDWKLEVIRSNLLRHSMALEQLVMSSDREYSAILVHRLYIRDEEMHKMVLDGFKQCGDAIMGSRQGHAVFQALLRSIQAIIVNDRRYEELQIIVDAAVMPELISRSKDGVTSLMLLITAVAWNPALCTRLVNCFVRDRVMDDFGGDELIAHCFTRMDYDVTKALVTHAMDTIDVKLNSPYGVACLGTCFRYARGEELHIFQDTLVERAVPMAKGRDSNRLVQSLLDPDMDRIDFRRRLLSRLMQHVVSLSNNWYGRFVLRHCFTSEDKELQPIALTACADLPRGDFQTLANHFLPLHRVLQGGNTDYPVTARRLARKIEALPPYIREHRDIHMRLAMLAVRRVLADNLADLAN